jgi:hypothetical protein
MLDPDYEHMFFEKVKLFGAQALFTAQENEIFLFMFFVEEYLFYIQLLSH